MTVVDLSADDSQQVGGRVFKSVRARLGQGTFDAGLIAKLEGYAR